MIATESVSLVEQGTRYRSFHSEALLIELAERAQQLRRDSVKMITLRGSGHPGGALSAAEIMAALFFHKLRIDPARPDWPDRDRFLLSKGHASAILYAALARRGFFPIEDLWQWGELDCHLQGHPDRIKTPGVEMSAGLLGHGVAIGSGLALSARMNGQPYRTYVLLGDGECQAGVVWEGAMTAAKFRLANLTAIVDYNDVQLDGPVHDIMPLEPLADKWRSFGWKALEINGHNLRQVLEALDTVEEIHSGPTVIIAHTTKGKGVSYMENDAKWHGAVPTEAQYRQAMIELGDGAH
jgi:transketolase